MTKTTLTLLLALAAGSACAQSPLSIEYQSTTGITMTTSGTPDGYLTGQMNFTTSQGSSFAAYCVELAQGYAPTSAGFQTYAYGAFTNSQASLLEGLYSSSYAGVTTPYQMAAFQNAVWEIMEQTPGTPLDVNTGNFQFYYLSATSTDAQDTAFANQANAYLQAAASYTGPAQYQLRKLTNATYQDYVIASAVPEPDSDALLLAGLGAVGLIVRRRRHG